jgi:hypothetical protein
MKLSNESWMLILSLTEGLKNTGARMRFDIMDII